MILKVIVGNLGKAPETKEIGDKGTKVCRFSVAAKYYARGEEKTRWHNVDVFGALGERCQKYLEKGQSVVIVGECAYSEKDGKEYENMTALKVQFGGRSKASEATTEPPKEQQPAAEPEAKAEDSSLDDIPF